MMSKCEISHTFFFGYMEPCRSEPASTKQILDIYANPHGTKQNCTKQYKSGTEHIILSLYHFCSPWASKFPTSRLFAQISEG
jgi:hypothetical protein